jgi:hypothetical protein
MSLECSYYMPQLNVFMLFFMGTVVRIVAVAAMLVE